MKLNGIMSSSSLIFLLGVLALAALTLGLSVFLVHERGDRAIN
jgi:hypothetical protein